jgi:hypothetical protein
MYFVEFSLFLEEFRKKMTGEVLTAGIGSGTRDVLEICQEIELSCAELYHYFAELFKNDRATLLFWRKAAMEVENHAKRFALIMKLRRQNIVQSIHLDAVEAEITQIYVKSFVDKLMQYPPSQEEAIVKAFKLETKLSFLHLENIVTFADPSFEKSLTAIAQSDRKYMKPLIEAYMKLKNSGSQGM